MSKKIKPPARSAPAEPGRDEFEAVSAVEGVVLSRGMREDFHEFDRRGLPAVERRRLLVEKYGRSR